MYSYIVNPIELIKQRFDIKIKFLYAKSLEDNIDIPRYRNYYKEHLEIWNGFVEFDTDGSVVKRGFEDFDSVFLEILRSIKHNGFDNSISMIPTVNKYPINGAHRIASCLLYNKQITCLENVRNQETIYDESFFIKKGLSNGIVDIVNREFYEIYTVS